LNTHITIFVNGVDMPLEEWQNITGTDLRTKHYPLPTPQEIIKMGIAVLEEN